MRLEILPYAAFGLQLKALAGFRQTTGDASFVDFGSLGAMGLVLVCT